MQLQSCVHEAAVATAVAAGRWPEGAAATLREHVAACEVCTEVVQIAGAMAGMQSELLEQANLPSAGQIWWRAKMRARAEAARAAQRPILFVQALTATCALVAFTALGAAIWPWIVRAAARLELPQLPGSLAWASAGVPLPAMVLLGALAVAAPIAIYLVVARE